MTLLKELFRAFIYFALVYVYGCGSVGWLPSLSVAVAGIDRTEHHRDQTERKRLILKAEARLRWRLTPDRNRSVSQALYNRRTAISRIHYRTRHSGALREWENRERNRVIDQTSQGWRQ